MKRLISVVLALVLILALAVHSFAQTADGQSTSLQSGWGTGTSNSYPTGYYNSWFYRVLTWFDYLNDNILTINSRLTSWDTDINSITIISDAFKMLDTGWYPNSNSYPTSAAGSWFSFVSSKLYTSDESLDSISSGVSALVPDVDTINLYLTNTLNAHLNDISGYLSLMKDDVSMLQQVLADEEDLAFKESQKENQALIQDTFFTPGNDLSLDTSKITQFTNQFTDFTEAFDFSESVPAGSSPLDSISEGSEFSQWFTNETGLDMDPTFGGGSGGGGGEDPDPDPDPDPEPTVKNWLPLATTEPGGNEILNGTGFLPGYYFSFSSNSVVSSSSRGVTGFIPCEPGDVIYFYNVSQPYSLIYFFDSNMRSSVSQGSLSFDGNVYSYTTPDDVNYFRLNVLLEGFDISSAVISINQYPIQTVSTFSLRSVSAESEIVTTAYADRMAEYKNLLRGGN